MSKAVDVYGNRAIFLLNMLDDQHGPMDLPGFGKVGPGGDAMTTSMMLTSLRRLEHKGLVKRIGQWSWARTDVPWVSRLKGVR